MVNRQRTQTLDGLAWASLSEDAVICRLANQLVRDWVDQHKDYGFPTNKSFEQAIRSTVPPRGRAGPMFEPLVAEFRRQRDIYTKRKKTHQAWEDWEDWREARATRVNFAYAGAFGRAVWRHRQQNPYDWGLHQAEYKKWEDDERARDKGDNCVLLIKHQNCIIAVLQTEGLPNGEAHTRAQIKVKYLGSGRVYTTYLRSEAHNFGQLLHELGGYPVTGALAHGHRVEVDWPGRRFNIHDPVTGEITVAPWRVRRYVKTDDVWHQRAEDIDVIGRKVIAVNGEKIINVNDELTD